MYKYNSVILVCLLCVNLFAAVGPKRSETLGNECARKLIPLDSKSDPELLKDAFAKCLSLYVRIPTINRPGQPGTEYLATRFLSAVLGTLGIPSQEYELPDRFNSRIRRMNLMSCVEPNPLPRTQSVLLVSHTDVVDVFPEQWSDPQNTFSGHIGPNPKETTGEQYVWGRGALDMKSTTILQLMTLWFLKKERTPLHKRVCLLAVADEEEMSSGSVQSLREMRHGGMLSKLQNPVVAFNEGGFAIRGAAGEKTVLHAIGTEDKGGAWIEVKHTSAQKLFEFMDRMKQIPGPALAASPRRCQLLSVTTPKPKANVVASEVSAEIQCENELNPNEVHDLFPFEGAKVTVTRSSSVQFQIRIETTSSGHGSLALNASALEILARGLERIRAWNRSGAPPPDFYRFRQTNATTQFLNHIGSEHRLFTVYGYSLVPHLSSLSSVIQLTDSVEQWILRKVGWTMGSERLFRTSCAWSAMNANANGANAYLDCRIVSPEKADEFIAAMNTMSANDPGLLVRPLVSWNFTQSPFDNGIFSVMKQVMKSTERPGWRNIVTPFLFPMSSDNTYYREPSGISAAVAPMPAYGFLPMELTVELVKTIHGSDERFPLSEAALAAQRYVEVIRKVAQ